MKKSAVAVVLGLVCMTCFAPSVFAMNTPTQKTSDFSQYSVAQLTELIAQLTKQLEELKKNSATCFVSEKALSLGDGESGDGLSGDVIRLQSFLREKGYFTFHKNTGFFGKLTMAALVSFQNKNGMSATGDFDSATRAKIHTMSCIKTTVAANGEEKKVDEVKKIETPASTPVTSIALTANGGTITWAVSGYSKNGFKIAWSKTSGPTYPTRNTDTYEYLSSPTATQTTLNAFDGPGTYYVRVCEYLGGACGVYSNEVQVTL